jgi:hypothetical protein
MSDRKDLPTPASKNFETRVRETLMTYLGRTGDPLDRGVTLRDLLDSGLAKLRPGRSANALTLGGDSLPIIPGQTGGAGEAYEPDLTAPPTPTGFSVSAGISMLYIEHDTPTYTQGHGHLRTRLYGKIVNQGDPLPVFADAAEISQFTGEIHSYPSNPSTQWRLWIKWESADGIVSVAPAGGTNGVAAGTTTIRGVDLGPLIVEAANLANGSVSAGKLATEAVAATNFASGIEPVTVVAGSTVPTTKSTNTIFLQGTGKLYRWNGAAYTKDVVAADVDSRGLNVKAEDGSVVFGANGFIGSSAYLTVDGNNVSLSDLAASQLVPNLNFVGAFSSPPTQTQLGSKWLQNAVYRNTADGFLYVLTGTPLGWVLYLEDGVSFVLTVESTNGTTFRVGQNTSTLLKGRLFKNGAEVTDVTPAAWFRWRRVSAIPQAAPNDDATWNASYQTGYKQVSISVDSVYARATFFCDIIST